MAFDWETSAEDIKVFLDEAEEQLQLIEEDIVKLERDATPELLQEIFRAAHTLKGSSATLGHKKMAEVTHQMENLLDKLRKGKLLPTTAVADALFAALDVLKVFKEEIATGQEIHVEIAQVVAQLVAAEGDPGSAAVAATSAAGTKPAAPVAAAGGGTAVAAIPGLTGDEQRLLTQSLAGGSLAFFLILDVDKSAAMPAVRAFQALLALGDLGQVVRSWPSQEEVEADAVGEEIKAVLVTNEGEARVRECLALVPDISLREARPLVANVAAGVLAPPSPVTPPPVATSQPLASPTTEAAPAVTAAEVPSAAAPAAAPAAAQPMGAAPSSLAKPNRTVRVDVEVLDNLMNLVGELVIDRTRLERVLSDLGGEKENEAIAQRLNSSAANIGRVTSELQGEIMRARMIPVENLFKKFPRMVRDTAQKAGKEINFTVLGEDTELDRSVIEEIGDPLMHLLRNSVDHGVEPPVERLRLGKPQEGQVVLEARHEENHILICVRDDGRGIDPAKLKTSAIKKGIITDEQARRMTDSEAINLIFAPGFSTADKISDISGRGVGLDVVHRNLEKINGTVEVITTVGKGTEFRIKLPLTLAIISALVVEHTGNTYCLPLSSVEETNRWPASLIQTVRGREVVVHRGQVVPILRLEEVFEMHDQGRPPAKEFFVVIVNLFGKQFGLVVDGLLGEQEVVIKNLGKFIGDVSGVSGAAIMGDGNVAIILDVQGLVNLASLRREAS